MLSNTQSHFNVFFFNKGFCSSKDPNVTTYCVFLISLLGLFMYAIKSFHSSFIHPGIYLNANCMNGSYQQ